jgi:hypothetical protein
MGKGEELSPVELVASHHHWQDYRALVPLSLLCKCSIELIVQVSEVWSVM